MKKLKAIVLLTLAGCSLNSNPSVYFVVPDGYQGTVDLILDRTNGVDIVLTDGRYTLEIPDDGKLRLRSFQIFETPHHEFARYRNGMSIPTGVEPRGSGEVASNLIGFLDTGMHEGTKYPQRTIVYVVGTQSEMERIRDR